MEKKEKSTKAETIKRLSPSSKCYRFSNVYCFILEFLEFKYFSVFHGPTTLKSISPALPNLGINMCRTSSKAYESEVRAGWYFLVRFITCNDLAS